MAIRPVLRIGDPRLRETSRPVEDFGSPFLRSLVEDMHDTMAACDGAGLAAPQIGVPLRVMVFGFEHNPRYPEAEAVPATVLVNPEFEVLDEAQEAGWEGCLSVPGLRGWVSRHAHIRYRGFSPEGKPLDRIAQGFHARVFQHELDHLDGVLYTDRIADPARFGFIEELQAAGLL